MLEDWFKDMRKHPLSEIPVKVVSSVQEVINDNAPGLAVESLRDEVSQLKRIVRDDRYLSEALKSIVVNLSGQVSDGSGIQAPRVIKIDY